jgi:hypothetical protein
MTKNDRNIRKAVSTSNLQTLSLPSSTPIVSPAGKSYADSVKGTSGDATGARMIVDMRDPMQIVAARSWLREEAEAKLDLQKAAGASAPHRLNAYVPTSQTRAVPTMQESSKPRGQDPLASPPFSLREMRDVLGTISRLPDRSPLLEHQPYPQHRKHTGVASNHVSFQDGNATDSILSLPSVPAHNPKPVRSKTKEEKAAEYTTPFTDFLTDNPTVFHTVAHFEKQFVDAGYTKLSERDAWKLKKGGKYFLQRNGSSAIAFSVGDDYEPGNGAAMIAGHIDALTTKLKPIPKLRTKAGYVQLGVAPYAGALNDTWWDRDLAIGGKVLVKESSGKVTTKLVKLNWPSKSCTSLLNRWIV